MWDLLYKVLGSTYRAGFTEGFNFHDEKEFEITQRDYDEMIDYAIEKATKK